MVSVAETQHFTGPMLVERAVAHCAAETLVRLVAIDATGFDTEQLAEHALEIVRVTDRVRTVSDRYMALADANAASLTKGAHSMSGLANTECGISRSQGNKLTVLGTAPDRYPLFYAAVLEGRIGPGHIEVLHPVWTEIHKPHFDACEKELVDIAALCTPEEFAHALAEWRNCVDEDEALDEFIRNQADPHFQYGFDLFGNAHYSGTVGPEHAEPFIETIEQNAETITGQKPSNALGDSIVELVLNPDGKYRARLEVIVPETTGALLPDVAESTARKPAPDPFGFGFAQIRWPRTARGTLIPPAIVSGLRAKGAQISEHQLDRFGNVARDRDSGRYFNTVQKRLIRLRDNNCRHPGCRRPASQCEYDHVQPHELGGPTLIRNGQALCRFHHRWKHHIADKDQPDRPNRATIFDPRPLTILLE